MSNAIKAVTDSGFEQEVLKSKKPVLVDFWAEWCGPCRALAPILEEVANDSDNFEFVKIDIDKNPEAASQYGVRSIPTLMIFKNGQVEAVQMGLMTKSQLLAFLETNA